MYVKYMNKLKMHPTGVPTLKKVPRPSKKRLNKVKSSSQRGKVVRGRKDGKKCYIAERRSYLTVVQRK